MTESLLLPVIIVAGAVVLGLLPTLLRRRQGPRGVVGIGAALGIGVAAVAWLLYMGGENQERAQRIALHESDPQAAMGELAADMRERLQAEGEGAEPRNYFLLGRTLSAAGDWDGAVAAFAEANRRSNVSNADLLVAEAEARLNHPERDRASHAAAEDRIEAALALAPRHAGANFFAGALAIGAGNEVEALPHLRVVLQSDLLQGQARERLAQRVETISARQQETFSADASDSGGQISVTVTPEPGRVLEGGTLFVFVRESGGPPMPLAARRIDAPRWPATVTIGDADRLAGGASLFSRDTLDIAARWSQQGDALSDRDGPQASRRIDPAQVRNLDLQLASPGID